MYYVYQYKDPIDLQIRYIGKGIRNRELQHWLRRYHHSNQLFREYLIGLDQIGQIPIIERISTNLSNADAYILEFQLIKKYGRIGIDQSGILFNRSIGFEHFNYNILTELSDFELREYLNTKHFNCIELTEIEELEICKLYTDFNFGIQAIAKKFMHGPDKIKQVLLKYAINIKTRGGQSGELNGMFGIVKPPTYYFKNHKHTNESKLQISNSLKKPIILDGVQYIGIRDASIKLKVSESTIKRRIQKI